MRKIALVLWAWAILAMQPSSAPATQWHGELMVEATSSGCPFDVPGDFYTVTFSPANLGDNPPDSYLNFFGGEHAISFRVVNGNITGSFKPVEGHHIGSGYFQY